MPRGYRDDDEEELGQDIGGVTAIRDSGKALLCRWDDGTEHWIAKSQIHDDSEVYDMEEGKEGVLIVTPWLARKLEFIE
jgi:hypothetical protein